MSRYEWHPVKDANGAYLGAVKFRPGDGWAASCSYNQYGFNSRTVAEHHVRENPYPATRCVYPGWCDHRSSDYACQSPKSACALAHGRTEATS